MKIAVVAEFFYPNYGGQEQRLLEILQEISKYGHIVDVYTIRYKSSLPVFSIHEKINIHRIIDDFTYNAGGGLESRSIKTIIEFSLATCNNVKHGYDKIIFTQFPILPIFVSGLRNIPGTKILDFVEYREGWFWEAIFELEMKMADKVVCISNIVKDKATKICKNEKLICIPSSIDLDKFYHVSHDYFVFIGRMEPHKHPEDAIKAVLEYNFQYNSSFELHLVGGGSLLERLKQKYQEYNQIVFHGFVTEEEKLKVISKALGLIFPSEREGLPVSVIECMAAGVPVVTTQYENNGTYRFVKTEGIGIVVKPTIESLVEGIEKLLKNRESFSKVCNLKKKEYSADEAARRILAL